MASGSSPVCTSAGHPGSRGSCRWRDERGQGRPPDAWRQEASSGIRKRSKGNYIFGHLFGAIDILVGDSRKWFCLPFFMNLQDGLQTIRNWKKTDNEPELPSHVVQMIAQGFKAAKGFGQALLLLDRHFLSVPDLKQLQAYHSSSDARMHLVTKAKSNTVAYERPAAKKPGRGRPPKKGKTVKLKELSTTRARDFQNAPSPCMARKRRFNFYSWIYSGARDGIRNYALCWWFIKAAAPFW